MKCSVVAYLVVGIVCVAGAGDEQPVDRVAKELAVAKEEYVNALNRAREKLIAAFAEQQKKLEENKNLKVAEVIKLVDRLQAERKAFLADSSKLPRIAIMKVAVSEYESSVATAKKTCAAAFDKAAEEYRKNRDLAMAKMVLAEKDKFLSWGQNFVPGDVLDNLPGKWRVSFFGRTKDSSMINYQATWEFDKFGGVRSEEAKANGTWTYDPIAQGVVISWDNTEKSQEFFPVPLKTDGLTGKTWHGPGVQFTAKKIEPK
jgi:hypothetical protein